eukprot:CAMPEP_0118979146 /NCGR_PEP_ID=MMETSP1173-20130426/25278_1 /TAXON_ID=1034831 /ORGANISM="Rhizochromulina marina cf, Strain CCMP1243" /LENGTH=38 /DNA_ID= /DNA_START= /DNA_END= /DNA_ORIENTATION=
MSWSSFLSSGVAEVSSAALLSSRVSAVSKSATSMFPRL